ncbi:MAG TPA: helix-turn-helix domain-containing protein [Stellaceae bacterium]|jgi:AraC-like DNA-binding protein|nr:helix-turn-helix domain-containing protein [Stellaceae bacterium]
MSSIEAGLRGGGIAILLLLALVVLRDARQAAAARYYMLFLLSGVSYLVESAPGLMTTDPLWLVPLKFLSNISPALFQLWAWAAFDDAFKPSWLAWLPTAAMATLIGWAMTAHQWLPWRILQGAALVFVCVGVWQVLVGRQTDLVEGRRRFRLILSIIVGFVIAGLTIHGAVTNPALRVQSSLLTAGIVLALALASAVLQLGLRRQMDLALVTTGDVAAPAAVSAAPVAIDPEERALLDRLRRLMEEERVYREEGLGIAALAARLGLPEYRLRRLINQRLGHRNFTSFVNGYRLAETIAALSDLTQAQVPILTVALDAGFQSIGPFNRAFKAQIGMTPTDFRREHLGNGAQNAAE